MSIAVFPSKANQIRAFAEAHRGLTSRQIAEELGVTAREVDIALGRDPARRIKSVAR